MVVPERLQMTIWQRVACWISKATGSQAHSHDLTHARTHMHAHVRAHTTEVCNTDCFFTSTVLRTPLSVTLHVLCLLFIYYFSGLASVSAPSGVCVCNHNRYKWYELCDLTAGDVCR